MDDTGLTGNPLPPIDRQHWLKNYHAGLDPIQRMEPGRGLWPSPSPLAWAIVESTRLDRLGIHVVGIAKEINLQDLTSDEIRQLVHRGFRVVQGHRDWYNLIHLIDSIRPSLPHKLAQALEVEAQFNSVFANFQSNLQQALSGNNQQALGTIVPSMSRELEQLDRVIWRDLPDLYHLFERTTRDTPPEDWLVAPLSSLTLHQIRQRPPSTSIGAPPTVRLINREVPFVMQQPNSAILIPATPTLHSWTPRPLVISGRTTRDASNDPTLFYGVDLIDEVEGGFVTLPALSRLEQRRAERWATLSIFPLHKVEALVTRWYAAELSPPLGGKTKPRTKTIEAQTAKIYEALLMAAFVTSYFKHLALTVANGASASDFQRELLQEFRPWLDTLDADSARNTAYQRAGFYQLGTNYNFSPLSTMPRKLQVRVLTMVENGLGDIVTNLSDTRADALLKNHLRSLSHKFKYQPARFSHYAQEITRLIEHYRGATLALRAPCEAMLTAQPSELLR